MSLAKSLEYIIFDCDGVLVDSEIIAAKCTVEMFNELGLDMTLDYYLQHCTGKTFSVLKEMFSKEVTKPMPHNFLEEIEAKVHQIAKKELKAVPEVAETLQQITFPKAVVSNSELHQIKRSLTQTGLTNFFENRLFSSDMVAQPKPYPDLYLHAISELNVKPKNCLVIEDSVTGATAAINAGLDVIGFIGGSHITQGHEKRLLDAGVKQILTNMKDLPGLLTARF